MAASGVPETMLPTLCVFFPESGPGPWRDCQGSYQNLQAGDAARMELGLEGHQ